MPDTANISDSEDTDYVHLPKIKPRSEWLKPIPEEDRPETPEPDWKKKLSKSDLEGPTYKVAKAFQENSISLQFQMEKYHRMLTDQVDLVNPEGHRLVPDVSKPLSLGDHVVRADYKEYKISEADFKNLHLNDFEDLYLLHLQGQLNHLSGAKKVHLFNTINLWIRKIVIKKRVEDLQLMIESYQTKLNLTQPD
ncbi:hypothetical protein Tco_0313413 [Tanacetum coccineum]